MSNRDTIGSLLTIYFGTSLFMVGVLGNAINVCVFAQNNLRNPSTFLLLVLSCCNFVHMFTGLLMRVLSVGYNTNVLSLHLSWCKPRYGFVQFCTLCSMSYACYIAVDQFLVTSNQVRWRRLSRISLTRRMVAVITLFSLLYSIPFALHASIIPSSDSSLMCTFHTSDSFYDRLSFYFTYPILWALAPICVLCIFGAMTYRNVSLLRGNANRERAQRHLTSMILLNILFIVVGMFPIALFYSYFAFTLYANKSAGQQAMDTFFENVVSLIAYVPFSCSFFVYYLSSKTYRQQVKQLLHPQRRILRVVPRSIAM